MQMQMQTVKKAAKALIPTRQEAKIMLVTALAVGAKVALAEDTIDLAPINKAIATITSVGTIVFTVFVTIKTFKWVRSSL